MTPRTIAFLGKSGSGKDTQIELLAQKLKPALIEITGDRFRKIAKMDTVAGRKIRIILDEGGLPPGWFAEYLWQDMLIHELKGEEHLIFGGSPRRIEEAKELDEVLEWFERSRPEAVLLDISDDEAVERLLKRGRHDDTEESTRERLKWFEENVGPVIDYYEKSGRLRRVDGMGTVEEVFERIKDALKLT